MIVTPPSDQFEINNGSSATFVCRALAFPPHQVSWSFTNASGVLIDIISTVSDPQNRKYFVNRMNGSTDFGTLTVWNVRYEDRGVYTCNASNEIGAVDASAMLTVHGKLHVVNFQHLCKHSYTSQIRVHCVYVLYLHFKCICITINSQKSSIMVLYT